MAAINLTNRDHRRISEIMRLTRDVRVVKRAQALLWLSDGDTPNGTWVFDRAYGRKRLEHGDRIKCGSAAFLYLELESSVDDLTVITKEETRRTYRYPTARADHSGDTDVAVAREEALKVLFEMGRALNAIEDSAELQADCSTCPSK